MEATPNGRATSVRAKPGDATEGDTQPSVAVGGDAAPLYAAPVRLGRSTRSTDLSHLRRFMAGCVSRRAGHQGMNGERVAGGTIRIAVASTPLTATLDDAVPAAVAAIEEAGRLGASIVCLPETGLPGHRDQARLVPDVPASAIEERSPLSVRRRAEPKSSRSSVPSDRRPRAGRSCRSSSLRTAAGSGNRRRPRSTRPRSAGTSPAAVVACSRPPALTFGIAICHEGFRYPEISRALVLGGAQVIFAPHYVVTDDGTLPSRWCDASNPYNEKALMCRALENTVYLAASNVAGPDQGSITGIVAPDGTLVTSLPYGEVGVVAADIDLALADRHLALRWAPDRSAHARR